MASKVTHARDLGSRCEHVYLPKCCFFRGSGGSAGGRVQASAGGAQPVPQCVGSEVDFLGRPDLRQ